MAYTGAPSTFEQTLQSQGYVALPDFAVIDECEFFDSKTRQKVHLDPARLEKLAREQNRRIEARNDATPIIVGHTKDGAAEQDQPQIVGYATNFHVGRLPDGKAAVFARPWAKKGEVETFRKHPRRSVELWLDPDAIDPIALLGATTPRRDLGLHLFQRHWGDGAPADTGSVVRFARADALGRQPILFEMREDAVDNVKCDEPGTATTPPTPPPAIDQAGSPDDATVDKVANSDWGKKLSATLDKVSAFMDKFGPILEQVVAEEEGMEGQPGGDVPPGAGAPPGAAAPPGAGAAPPAGGPQAGPDAEPEEDTPPPPDRAGGPDKKNSAGYSAPGYGNTSMPSYDQYSRGDYENRVRLQRLETDLTASKGHIAILQQENAALKLARIEDEARADLDALKREGFTVVDEVDFPQLCKLTRDDRAKHVRFMRDTRTRKDVTPLPAAGQMPVRPDEQLVPLQFSRDSGPGLPGDPALAAPGAEPTYEELIAMAGDMRKQGKNLFRDYDVKLMRGAANGEAVKVR